jgi:hypothetical protein
MAATWNPAWEHIEIASDPVGDEVRDGSRWTITYEFRRTPESDIETRVFPGLMAAEYKQLVSPKWEWLGGDPGPA